MHFGGDAEPAGDDGVSELVCDEGEQEAGDPHGDADRPPLRGATQQESGDHEPKVDANTDAAQAEGERHRAARTSVIAQRMATPVHRSTAGSEAVWTTAGLAMDWTPTVAPET